MEGAVHLVNRYMDRTDQVSDRELFYVHRSPLHSRFLFRDGNNVSRRFSSVLFAHIARPSNTHPDSRPSNSKSRVRHDVTRPSSDASISLTTAHDFHQHCLGLATHVHVLFLRAINDIRRNASKNENAVFVFIFSNLTSCGVELTFRHTESE